MSRLKLSTVAALMIGLASAAVGYAQKQPATERNRGTADATPAADHNGQGHHAKAAFEVYKDKAGEYRWRLRATNTQILAIAAQGYSDKRSCMNAIESIKHDVADAPVEEKEAAAQGKGDEGKAGSSAAEGGSPGGSTTTKRPAK